MCVSRTYENRSGDNRPAAPAGSQVPRSVADGCLEEIMTTILIVVVLLMLFGGGGYYGYRRRWG
jgi:hypothetical protein